jgi:molybdopterin converting factor small subunit
MGKSKLVSIEFFGTQRIIVKSDSISMPITQNTIASDALKYVRDKYPALSLEDETILITVNQEVVPHDTLLKADDIVCFVPGIGGG